MAQTQPPLFTWGRGFLSLNAIITMLGPYIADFNETHVYNPNWPPHAKFHNGQTMSMGLGLGLVTLYLTYRPSFDNGGKARRAADDGLVRLATESRDVFAAALVGTLYWVTGLSAALYPGAAPQDPEFGSVDEFPQLGIFVFTAGLAWVGWALEGWRIGRARGRGAGRGAKRA